MPAAAAVKAEKVSLPASLLAPMAVAAKLAAALRNQERHEQAPDPYVPALPVTRLPCS